MRDRAKLDAGGRRAWMDQSFEPHGWLSDLYFSDEWIIRTGPNACWRRGEYPGPKLLVNIAGFGGEMEQLRPNLRSR
ncbi:MAG TPA: hypothetical protein VJT69_13975 [Pyrinomonadaceae bacterium]|nr:hypothetical protein [Pyrinomonadaceae bacterium]